MPYTYILGDSIKSPTLILTADHSTLLFLPGFFFYKIKNFLFLLWVNLYMITNTYLHDPPSFNGLFFMTPPFVFCSLKKLWPSLCFHPLLISDKSLSKIHSSFFLSSSKQMKRAKNYGGYMESSKKLKSNKYRNVSIANFSSLFPLRNTFKK